MTLIASVIIDALIVVISILLVKKVKPNKSNMLNLAFGTFWLGAAGAYFFAGLADLSGVINSAYFSRLFFLLAISLAVIPVFSLSLFLGAAYLKKKSIWILPAILSIFLLMYLYFVLSAPLNGPFIEWTLKYQIKSAEPIILIQYLGYACFAMVSLLSLTAFKARKTSTFIQFNSVAASMGLFFLGGYLDLLGSVSFETVLFRALIVVGVLIGYYGFSPGIKTLKLAGKFT